jgi:hypothetical protein
MVAPVIAAGAMALIRLIAWLSSVVMVSSYVRDIATQNSEENIQVSQDATVEEILNNDDLSDSQKENLVKKYIEGNSSGSEGSGYSDEDLKKYAVLGFLALGALSVLGGRR